MPNVRASSGMIGTIRSPSALSRSRLRSSLAKAIVVDGFLRAGAGHELAVDRVARQLERLGHDDAARHRPAQRRAAFVQVLDLRRVAARVVVGRVLELLVGDGQLAAGRGRPCSSCSVIFLAWCVMLRPSTPVPSVQPLTVLARITVGRPCGLGRRVVRGIDLAVVVAAAAQVQDVVVGQVRRPSPGAAGPGRRSARGCRRRSRPSTSGTRRRASRSSCRRARRRRRGRAGRPTRGPR